MRSLVAAIVVAAAVALAPATARAVTLRSCQSLSGYEVRVDPVTTTCGLARSAASDYIFRLGYGHGIPSSIVGWSAKTRSNYRFRLNGYRSGETWNSATYVGRAGDARLLVKITGRLY